MILHILPEHTRNVRHDALVGLFDLLVQPGIFELMVGRFQVPVNFPDEAVDVVEFGVDISLDVGRSEEVENFFLSRAGDLKFEGEGVDGFGEGLNTVVDVVELKGHEAIDVWLVLGYHFWSDIACVFVASDLLLGKVRHGR